MKFTPEVVAALEVLRNAAENDFERHRLDVLERDLTSPPQVEVVDNYYQKFDGTLYRKRKPRYENQACHYQQSVQIHQVIWRYHYGEIPDGYVVHHRNLNPADNDISNLQLLTNAEHQQLHRAMEGAIRKNKQLVCKNWGKIFLAYRGDSLYCSTKCKNAFYRHSQETQETVCEWCGKSFLTRPSFPHRFCSNSCASKWRRSRH